MTTRTAELVTTLSLWIVCMTCSLAGFAIDAYLVQTINGPDSWYSQHVVLLVSLAIAATVSHIGVHRFCRDKLDRVSLVWYVAAVAVAMLVLIPTVFVGAHTALLLSGDSPASFRNPLRAVWNLFFGSFAVCLGIYWLFRLASCLASRREAGSESGRSNTTSK